MRRLGGLALVSLLLGCGAEESGPVDAGARDAGALDAGRADAGAVDVDAGRTCAAVEPTVVTFATADGVTLSADLYSSGVDGGAAAVLLHMIPPGNDRSNFPRAFVDALVTRCVTVLNVDRRGAGASEGVALEAFEGPNGVEDAAGAVAFLMASDAAPAPDRVAVVGASNGTTTTLDFVVRAAASSDIAPPAAVVFLSGGAYSENQNALRGSALEAIPTLFVYPTGEAAWNEAAAVDAPEGWVFEPVDPGAHGTRLFEADPTTVPRVADFVAAQTN